MKLVFRKFPAGEAPPPAAGEVHLRPHRPEHRDRRDLAALVHEGGPDVLPRGPGEVEAVVVDATGTAPTLDELLAATFAMRLLAGDKLPDGCKAFVPGAFPHLRHLSIVNGGGTSSVNGSLRRRFVRVLDM